MVSSSVFALAVGVDALAASWKADTTSTSCKLLSPQPKGPEASPGLTAEDVEAFCEGNRIDSFLFVTSEAQVARGGDNFASAYYCESGSFKKGEASVTSAIGYFKSDAPAPSPAPYPLTKGTGISLQACNASAPAQQWAYDSTDNSLYLKTWGAGTICMQCAQPNCAVNGSARVWDCQGKSEETWELTGSKQVASKKTGACLRRTNSVFVQLDECDDSPDAKFQLESNGLFRSQSDKSLCLAAKEQGVSCQLEQFAGYAWCDASKKPEERVELLLAEMSLEEKDQLLYGHGMFPYTGDTPSNVRLGIPALSPNDGPQGFRQQGGSASTTQWPCALAVGASWDPNAAHDWGRGMGEEFAGKGSNCQLGPGVNINRVPVNGRNFEYISGEDPLLGYILAGEAVKGIQSQGVIANAKHYILNSQETNRKTVSENADERTIMEIYAEPFRGAVDAGVLSFMCSYNLINGTWACENEETLNTVLKGYLGFKYFVMSDWGGTHSAKMAVEAGLDQSQPDGSNFGKKLVELVQAGNVSEKTFDDATRRVLLAMFTGGLFDVQPSGSLEQNVTSKEHSDLARDLAERSAILLKNKDALLPMDHSMMKRIAVLGKPGHSAIITGGGGSGHVKPSHSVSPLDGVMNFLKEKGANGVNVTYYDGTDTAYAQELASEVDLVITVLATSSGEGSDRSNLDLPSDQLDLAHAAALGNPSKSVALVIAPGPTLMPFADSTAAVMLMFMPGQEEGAAFANLIFGASSPSGRLPITIPNKENEVGFTQKQYPGLNDATLVEYTEQLEVGYRWYNAHSVKPHFAFGHGLAYTSFDYSELAVDGRQISVKVSNIGIRDGVEVVQLYLDYPAEAGEPPLQLRGFQRVAVKAGQAAKVEFDLADKAVSIWDVDRHAYQVVPGSFVIFVGASSQDIRLKGEVKISKYGAAVV